jgi:HlyD family secretion protein
MVARIQPQDSGTNLARIDVVSPFAGRIAQVLTHTGAMVGNADPLFNLSSQHDTLEAIVLVPIDEGKKLRAGMPAHVTPSTVNQQKYGFIYGSVSKVAEYASSAGELKTLLGNEELVKVFQQGSGTYQAALIRATVRLDLDSHTFSGYRWSSGEGPPFAINTATVCSAEVVTGTSRPIELVVPFLLKKSGVESPR